ncbi:hypothetical protein AKJ16_DCAP05208 [Drosera capensis]
MTRGRNERSDAVLFWALGYGTEEKNVETSGLSKEGKAAILVQWSSGIGIAKNYAKAKTSNKYRHGA